MNEYSYNLKAGFSLLGYHTNAGSNNVNNMQNSCCKRQRSCEKIRFILLLESSTDKFPLVLLFSNMNNATGFCY